MPTLHILQGPDKGHTFEVNHSPSLIGRNSPDLPLADNTISRKHAELFNQNGVWSIRDLNSANGTYVNGVKVSTSLELKQGDQIRCGTTLIVFGGVRSTSISGEPADSLNIDENGNLVESAIMATTPSMDDSVIIAAPETSNAVGSLRFLYELSNAISSIFDRQQLLEKVMDMIFDNFPTDRGFILLRDGESAELTPAVVRYRGPEHKGKITVSHTIVNHAIEHKEGVICTNAMRDPRFMKEKSVHAYTIHSALCVPIIVHDKNMGVIYIDTTMSTHTYAAEQLRLLTAVGFQTGLALEHARLYEAGVQAERLAAAGETVAYLSHSIKNILQSLQSAADMVEIGLNKSNVELAKKGWKILERNLGKVQNLVLNMLAFSKVRQPNLVLTQLNFVLTEVMEMLNGQAEEKHVALISDFNEDLPPIYIDTDGIQQVILNLAINALDAVDPDNGVITVKTDYDVTNHQAIIEVRDNGMGISPNRLEHLFQAFHSTKGQGGTGLGLSVVKKIIEEHNGSIHVSSSPGEGTTFSIRIPTQPQHMTDSGRTAGPPITRKSGAN